MTNYFHDIQAETLTLVGGSDDGNLFTISAGGSTVFAVAATGAVTQTGAGADLVVGDDVTVTGDLTVTGPTALNGSVTIGEADNIVLGTTTGTKIGTATSQKVAFFNSTPIVQPLLTADLLDSLQALGLISSGAGNTPLDLSAGALTCGALTATGDANIGNATTDLIGFHGATATDQCAAYTQTFSTADRTHAARTATALTDNSAGSADTTIQALADGTTYANDVAAIRNNFADLALSCNEIIADLADTASVVNALVDDLQEKGLVG